MPQIDLSFLITPRPLWWLGILVALLVGFWAYHRLAAPIGNTLRTLLRVIRALALLILLLALLEPLLTLRGEDTGHARLALLVDRSSSMQLPGGPGETRGEKTGRLLSELEERLGEEFDLDVQGFAAELEARRRKEPTYPWEPLGVTALGEALEELFVRQADSPVGGVLLLTDGMHTSGKDPVLVARNLPVPVFSVVVGDSTPPADLLLRQVRSQPVGYVSEPVAVRVILESWGLPGREATISVRERPFFGDTPRAPGRVLAQRTITLPDSGGREIEVALEVVPSHVGLTLYEISASLDAGETIDTSWENEEGDEEILINNQRLFAVEVREKKTRVLYIEAEPDWDFSFLKRTLDADTSLAYTYLVPQADGGVIRYGAPGPKRIPRNLAELAPYAAVILGRATPEQLPHETVEALKAFLLEGGGVLLLGAALEGDLERWTGAWGDMLPVAVRAETRHGFTATLAEVTLVGLSHEITGLSESPLDTESAWKMLPPVSIREGRYRVTSGAQVLLNAHTSHPSREVPLLALSHAGAGRVAVLTGRGFWRWDFLMRSVSGDLPEACDFWKRMMRWLSEPSSRERFKVTPARHVFQDSEPPAFAGRLYDETFQPARGARVGLTIERVAPLDPIPEDELGADDEAAAAAQDRRIDIQLYPDGPAGRYAGVSESLPPGMYRYRATAASEMQPRETPSSSEGVFWVERMGPEFYNLEASWRLPRVLARASGGLVFDPQQTSELVSAVPERYKRVRVVRQAEMWNHWAVFVFILAMLSLEWIVRRRKGLV